LISLKREFGLTIKQDMHYFFITFQARILLRGRGGPNNKQTRSKQSATKEKRKTNTTKQG
jgi:hypothetical protein